MKFSLWFLHCSPKTVFTAVLGLEGPTRSELSVCSSADWLASQMTLHDTSPSTTPLPQPPPPLGAIPPGLTDVPLASSSVGRAREEKRRGVSGVQRSQPFSGVRIKVSFRGPWYLQWTAWGIGQQVGKEKRVIRGQEGGPGRKVGTHVLGLAPLLLQCLL